MMSTPDDALQAEIDGLYALPLDRFTPSRDDLARRLRSEGDRDTSAEIKRLRKPNLIAWALNRIRHGEPEVVDRLIEAGERLQAAQQQLVAGGERGVLRDAAGAERRLVDEVVARAEQELRAAGHPAGATLQSKLWATVHAAAVSPEPRELLRSGRLLRDFEVSDLGLAGAGPAAVVPAREQPRSTTGRETTALGPAKRDTVKRETAAHGGADTAGRETAERKEAERRARSVQRELERARRQQQTLTAKRAGAQRRASEAGREAARAQAELERAQAAVEQADARAADADERVRALEAELDGLDN